LLGRIVWGILGYWVLVYFIKRRQILGSVLMVCCSVFLISGLGKDVYSSAVKGTNWCFQSVSKDTFVTQVKKIFSDRDITTDYGVDVDVFITRNAREMGLAELIDDEAYTVNVSYNYQVDGLAYNKVYNDKIKNAENIYGVRECALSDVEEYIEILNEYGLYVNSFTPIDVSVGEYYLVDLDAPDNYVVVNTVWTTDDGVLEVDKETASSDCTLSFIAGRYYDWHFETVIKIYEEENGEERELASINLGSEQISDCTVTLNTDSNKLLIKAVDYAGEEIGLDDNDKVFIINAKVY
jgi:hypothetical protein